MSTREDQEAPKVERGADAPIDAPARPATAFTENARAAMVGFPPQAPPRPVMEAPPPSSPPPSEGRVRRAMTYAAEAIVALGLAFVFFGIFLALLGVFFPAGIQLRELVSANRTTITEIASATTAPAVVVAKLSVLKNDVRSKPAGAVAWGPAVQRLPLHDRDAIQTLSTGRGVVTFDDGDEIHLEKNSLLIISARSGASAEAAADDATASVVMVDGEIWGRLRLGANEKMSVALPGGAIQLAAGNHAGAEFRVAVQRDKSSTISVYHGAASVSAKGKTVTLTANQGTRVTATGEVTAPRDLAAAPRVLSPADGTELRYGDFPPQVLFKWEPVAAADRYRIVVARDRELRDVVIDRTLERTEFLAGRLTGRYYWRLASLRDDLEGRPSDWTALSTTRFGEPPKLVVDEVPKVLESSTCVLKGRTRRGSRVIVSGESVPVSDDGSFEHTLTLEPGANVLTVEAIDAEGNASYWTKVVHGKF